VKEFQHSTSRAGAESLCNSLRIFVPIFRNKYQASVLQVAEILVDTDIPGAEFCCDLPACKGACCTLEGGRGAPLDDAEAEEIRKALPFVLPSLPRRSAEEIARRGPVEGNPGDMATVCVDNRECVFAIFEQGVAACSLERAHLAGATSWRKPLSCHLFPIRVRRNGRTAPPVLRYEQIAECAPGRARGAREGVRLSAFLKDPLARAFGLSWYEAFAAHGAGAPSHDHGARRP
jgi:hypothetical protein